MNFSVKRLVSALCPHSGQKLPSNSVPQLRQWMVLVSGSGWVCIRVCVSLSMMFGFVGTKVGKIV